MSDLKNLLDKYLNSDADELEYRIKLTHDQVRHIMNSMKDKWINQIDQLEQSVNIIYSSNNPSKRDIKQIRKITFSGLKPSKQEMYEKQHILREQIDPLITINLSNETPLTKLTFTDLSYGRIKNRLSIRDGIYRIDITQTIEISRVIIETNKQAIGPQRIVLFGSMGSLYGKDLYEAFANNIFDYNNIEFEIEVDKSSKLSVDDIQIDAINNIIPVIRPIIDYNRSLTNICKLLKETKHIVNCTSIKTMTSKAITLSNREYMDIFPPINYYVTHKADGLRSLLHLNPTNSYLITSNDIVPILTKSNSDIILDCEYIVEKSKSTVLVFDILYNDEDVTNLTLETRLSTIDALFKTYKDEFKKEKIHIERKHYVRITDDVEDSFKIIKRSPFDYPEDGYILSSNDTYFKTKHYKIKPHNTIDFLAIKLPKQLVKNVEFPPKKDHTLYILFVGIRVKLLDKLRIYRMKHYRKLVGDINSSEYVPIQFSPSDNPSAYLWYVPNKLSKELDGYMGMHSDPARNSWIIVELEPVFVDGNPNNFTWKYHGVRTDRINEPNYYGNDFVKVAEDNWFVSQNPLLLESMHIPPDVYFSTTKAEIYKAQVHSVSYGKSKLISEAKEMIPNLFVFDLAAGKGQDLHRYMDQEYEKGLFLDIDRTAIASLIHKRYDLMKSEYYNTKKFRTNVGVQDLTRPSSDVLNEIKHFFVPEKPGLIICNLAIHYLIFDQKHLLNFISLVKKSLHKDGYFIYTTFDGKKINSLFDKTDKIEGGVEKVKSDAIQINDEWIVYEDEVVKYRIIKHYKGNKLENFGQKISVKLPFSGSDMYQEHLVNIDFVNGEFIKHGFEIVRVGSMGDYIEEIAELNPRLYNKLSVDDKKYIDLYGYCILKLKK